MARKGRSKRKLRRIDVIIIIVIIIIISTIGIRKIMNNKTDVSNAKIANQQEQENESKEQYVKILEDGSKLNISTKLKENKKVDNIVIKDIQLMYKDGVTNILANVENTGSTKLDATKLEITLLDDKGETVYKMQGLIEETDAGAISKLNSSITADFANVYDFTVAKK